MSGSITNGQSIHDVLDPYGTLHFPAFTVIEQGDGQTWLVYPRHLVGRTSSTGERLDADIYSVAGHEFNVVATLPDAIRDEVIDVQIWPKGWVLDGARRVDTHPILSCFLGRGRQFEVLRDELLDAQRAYEEWKREQEMVTPTPMPVLHTTEDVRDCLFDTQCSGLFSEGVVHKEPVSKYVIDPALGAQVIDVIRTRVMPTLEDWTGYEWERLDGPPCGEEEDFDDCMISLSGDTLIWADRDFFPILAEYSDIRNPGWQAFATQRRFDPQSPMWEGSTLTSDEMRQYIQYMKTLPILVMVDFWHSMIGEDGYIYSTLPIGDYVERGIAKGLTIEELLGHQDIDGIEDIEDLESYFSEEDGVYYFSEEEVEGFGDYIYEVLLHEALHGLWGAVHTSTNTGLMCLPYGQTCGQAPEDDWLRRLNSRDIAMYSLYGNNAFWHGMSKTEAEAVVQVAP